MLEHAEVTERIIGCAMKVHCTLGPGFLESVYQRALAHEIRKAGLSARCAARIHVVYDGVEVGEFVADMIVSETVLIENMAARAISPEHELQLLHYLAATGVRVGLLLNFGALSLQIRRKNHPAAGWVAGTTRSRHGEGNGINGD